MAKDLEPALEHLRKAFDLGEPFRDPGVETFGLHNGVFPVGDTFLEVVSPVQQSTSAGRYREKRGGDGGYMVIMQAPDLRAAKARIEKLGVRIVFETSFADVATIHLHPKDTGGVLLSIDSADPPESWRWGGPDWRSRTRTTRVQGIAAAEIACRFPQDVAERWAQIMDLTLTPGIAPVINCGDGNGSLRFVECSPGEAEGIRCVRLACNDIESILQTGGLCETGEQAPRVSVVGTEFELSSE